MPEKVYILKLLGKDQRNPTYRVIKLRSAEVLTENADYPAQGSELNRDALLFYCRDANVFQDEALAQKRAERIRQDHGIKEAVCLLDYSKVFFPTSDRKRKKEERYREWGKRHWRERSRR